MRRAPSGRAHAPADAAAGRLARRVAVLATGCVAVLATGCTAPAGGGPGVLVATSPGAAGVGAQGPVTLPLNRAWVDGRQVDYVTTDVSDAAVAREIGANFAPRLRDALPVRGGRSVLERVYAFVDRSQPAVFQSGPDPVGPASTDRSYSPLWRMVKVRALGAGPRPVYRSEEAILQGVDRGELTIELTDVILNCPIVRAVAGAEPAR